ncbi:conserved hypothetical protein [Arcobacter nitrofigilis DSM 7299]|uniref:Uncharacterized protein n=2 Tax=Arcobacter nitrofigilis TaxID=28199 RepID=D5UZX8_ARCNC|nr:conserved hypothetical protein [Arcobacter nitrofigilis DSM 7299]
MRILEEYGSEEAYFESFSPRDFDFKESDLYVPLKIKRKKIKNKNKKYISKEIFQMKEDKKAFYVQYNN